MLSEYTNNYAEQVINQQIHISDSSRMKDWKPTTPNELRVFMDYGFLWD
jgi:hypothetical protein